MSKQQAIARYQKAQDEITSLVQTIASSDYPEEMESIAELVFTMDARIEALEYKITVLKDVLRKIQETSEKRKITLDSATAEGVTALVAKRRTNGAYSMIHERCMENARDDVAEFFKEIGISTEI
jgi:hypothetical protein